MYLFIQNCSTLTPLTRLNSYIVLFGLTRTITKLSIWCCANFLDVYYIYMFVILLLC